MRTHAASLLIEPRFRIYYGRTFGFGPGKAELLEKIDQTGSITEAAKAMEMSYMRAWKLVKSMERGLTEPLVRKLRGGQTHGGAKLTPTGRKMLKLYRELEASAQPLIRKTRKRLTSLLRK